VKRLKYAASINDEALPETTRSEFEMTYVDIGGVDKIAGITDWDEMPFEDAPSRARRIARDGDTIVSTVRTYLRAIAPVKSPPPNLIVSTGFAVVRSRYVDSAFLSYALRESSFVDTVVALSVGVSYPAVNASEIGTIPIPLPSPIEQRAIAAFLDEQTIKIDALVAKKRELIEKLNERRTALVSHIVTRGLPPEAARAAGLDPHPRLKPSGVEWLGAVPEHWDDVPLGYLVEFRGGATPDTGNGDFWDGDIPWVSPKDMKQWELADAEDHITDLALERTTLSLIPVGAVLIVVRGMILAHSFPVAITTAPLTINQDMKALICRHRLTPGFLHWLLSGLVSMFVSMTEESAHGTRKLETTALKNLPVFCPPPREQGAIAKYLAAESRKMGDMITKTQDAAERLIEYRTALITAAVTGKIDVRSTAANSDTAIPEAAA
jgi:type I restriction enzyme, S subunit